MLCVPWQLPVADVEMQPPQVGPLQPLAEGDAVEAAKQRVGEIKLTVGEHAWRECVARTDFKLELRGAMAAPVSRAYYKLLEIVRTTALPAPSSSLHLCDAPGGFAQAVLSEFPSCGCVNVTSLRAGGAIHFAPLLLREPRVNALTLGQGHDLTHPVTRDEIEAQVGKVDFITADGAGSCDAQPELAESSNALLTACEVETALRTQKRGGWFVLKIFCFARPVTRQLVALLSSCYARVYIMKPRTSRSVNDERYIVCEGFDPEKAPKLRLAGTELKPGESLRAVASVDDAWMRRAAGLYDIMARAQQAAIMRAVDAARSFGRDGKRPPPKRARR